MELKVVVSYGFQLFNVLYFVWSLKQTYENMGLLIIELAIEDSDFKASEVWKMWQYFFMVQIYSLDEQFSKIQN